MNKPNLPETFVANKDYHALVADLLNARDSFDPQSRVIELLGERLNVWPMSILDDREEAA